MPYRTIHSCHHHLTWDRSIAPAITVAPGEPFTIECLEASGGVISPDATADDIARLSPERANPVTGPIAIDGAKPGDVLEIELLGFATSGWGWTAIIPDFGLLADQFAAPYLLISRYNDQRIDIPGGATLPTRPFCGTIGVAPAQGVHPLIPPMLAGTGGNIDCKLVTAGAKLLLPVQVDHALLSVGDTHAAQGDGEVCGTAIESPITVHLKTTLRRDLSINAPQIVLPATSAPPVDQRGYHVTTGIATDLHAAARDAVRAMIDHLTATHRITPELAYCLCSVAGDLRIVEIVNQPNVVVAMRMPLSIFD